MHIYSNRSALPGKSQVTLSKPSSRNQYSTLAMSLRFPKAPYSLGRSRRLSQLDLLGARENFAFDFGNCGYRAAFLNLWKEHSRESTQTSQKICKSTPRVASGQNHRTA